MNNKKIFETIITEKRAKCSNERPKYGLRKLTVGVVSCLLGYMMFMTPNVTLAEKVEATPQAKLEANVESKEANTGEEVEQPKEEAVVSTETTQPTEEKLEVSADGADKKDAQSAPVPGSEAKNKDLEEKGDKDRDKKDPIKGSDLVVVKTDQNAPTHNGKDGQDSPSRKPNNPTRLPKAGRAAEAAIIAAAAMAIVCGVYFSLKKRK